MHPSSTVIAQTIKENHLLHTMVLTQMASKFLGFQPNTPSLFPSKQVQPKTTHWRPYSIFPTQRLWSSLILKKFKKRELFINDSCTLDFCGKDPIKTKMSYPYKREQR